MNDQTLGEELENEFKRTTSSLPWDEVVRFVDVGQRIKFLNRVSIITAKEYQEKEDGTFHVHLSSRPE